MAPEKLNWNVGSQTKPFIQIMTELNA